MLVSVVGKPSSGKSSFFKAATLIPEVAIAPYPFTTIKPQHGVTYVRSPCPCKTVGVTCTPAHGKCINGTRYIPIEFLDVAGLIPGAHEGKGLGNAFLSDLSRASCLINVVDASGTTDEEGKQTTGHDPTKDVVFLEAELDQWFKQILEKNWHNVDRKAKQLGLDHALAETLSGLHISVGQTQEALNKATVDPNNFLPLARELRLRSKPDLIAANKIDLPAAEANLQKLRTAFPAKLVLPCSAEAELALRQAAEKGLIRYEPGAGDFEILGAPSEKQRQALEFLRNFLKKYGSTGVQEILDRAVFDFLKMVVVYPVENETHYTDKNGRVLPDAFLLPTGSTPKDLAAAVHTDLAKNFVCAVDAKSHRKIAADAILKSGDVIKIQANA